MRVLGQLVRVEPVHHREVVSGRGGGGFMPRLLRFLRVRGGDDPGLGGKGGVLFTMIRRCMRGRFGCAMVHVVAGEGMKNAFGGCPGRDGLMDRRCGLTAFQQLPCAEPAKGTDDRHCCKDDM